MSLKDKCMLVQLTIGKPKLSEKDKRATTDVAVAHNASTEAVAVTKKLYPKHLLAPITTVESAARKYVESVTEARGKGLAVLPCRLFMPFQEKIGQFRIQFQQAVTVFLQNYANVLAQAQVQTGTMFDTKDYPDVTELKEQFTFDVRYPTLETAGTITLQMEAESLAIYKAEVEAQHERDMVTRQRGLYARLGEAVERIKVQCGKEDGKIYDSLTGNLAELLGILPALNLDDDPAFDALCKEAAGLVVAPESIRTVPEVRKQLATNAEDILAKMAGFL